MNRRIKLCTIIFSALVAYSVYSSPVFAQNTFENNLQKRTDSLLAPVATKSTHDELLPNDVLQHLISPSGWGGFGTYIFGGVGGDNPQPYYKNPDLISFGGFCFGDPQKAVNIALSVNVTKVQQIGDLSGNFVVSRQIFTGSSIAVGGLQLFASKIESDAPGSTFYVAFSHSIQTLTSETDGSSKLTYTIGIGTGRFYLKSQDDINAGRGAHGTAVFAGISYELIKNVNFNVEWSGINLGCSLGIKPFESPLAVGFGITNLTRYSSNQPNTSFIISYPLSVKR